MTEGNPDKLEWRRRLINEGTTTECNENPRSNEAGRKGTQGAVLDCEEVSSQEELLRNPVLTTKEFSDASNNEC